MVKKKTLTRRERRKKAIQSMVKTKSELKRLQDAQRAMTLIQNGATIEDIFREFKCTSVAGALQHIRNALRFGGQIIKSLIGGGQESSGPSVVTPPSIGRGGTGLIERERRRLGIPPFSERRSRDEQVAAAIGQIIQFAGKEFTREANRFFDISESDDIPTRVAKVVKKFYGPP